MFVKIEEIHFEAGRNKNSRETGFPRGRSSLRDGLNPASSLIRFAGDGAPASRTY